MGKNRGVAHSRRKQPLVDPAPERPIARPSTIRLAIKQLEGELRQGGMPPRIEEGIVDRLREMRRLLGISIAR